MVVDDDPDMRAVIRDFLRPEGYAVHEEATGGGLVDVLERGAPALLVLDKELPGPDGLDLLAYVSRRHPAVPVVLITAFGGSGVREEALRLGATRYLEKPFSARMLVECVRDLVGDGDARPETAGPGDERDNLSPSRQE
jgi:CheY-like chemotaxis protein